MQKESLEKDSNPCKRMARGGPNHKAKVYTDPSLLLQVLGQKPELVAGLGQYETVSRAGAVNPAGLVKVAPLVKGLLAVCPSASVAPGPLRQALLSMLTSMPEVNKTKWNGSTWSNLKQDRLATIFFHIKKLARYQDQMRLCASKLNASSFLQLQELVKMVKLPEEEDHQPLKKGEETPLQKGESLKNDEDAASLDSSGIPNMFLTPEKQEEKHPKASASHAKSFMMRREGSLQKEKGTHALQKALGYGSKPCKRPASLEKGKALAKGNGHTRVEGALAKGKGQPQGVAKSLGKGKKALEKRKKALEKGKKALEKGKKALEKGKKALEKGHQGMKDGPWYNVRKTNAKKPKRTYLTGCLEEGQGTRRILIVEVPATWSSQHEYICDEVMKSLRKDKVGKEEALQMRQVLVNKFP